MHDERLGDLVADLHRRVQRAHRILEDHADAAAAHVVAVDDFLANDVDAAEQRGAARDAAGRSRNQPHDALHADGLAAARFADDRERLALRHREARAAHGLHDAAVRVELDVQVLHVEDRARRGKLERGAHSRPRRRTSSASRKPSPSKLNASTATLMKSAGNMSSWGCASIVLMPSLLMLPHDGVGGATPMPMNDRNASMKMTRGTSNVSVTRITPIVFGIMWRNTR